MTWAYLEAMKKNIILETSNQLEFEYDGIAKGQNFEKFDVNSVAKPIAKNKTVCVDTQLHTQTETIFHEITADNIQKLVDQ